MTYFKASSNLFPITFKWNNLEKNQFLLKPNKYYTYYGEANGTITIDKNLRSRLTFDHSSQGRSYGTTINIFKHILSLATRPIELKISYGASIRRGIVKLTMKSGSHDKNGCHAHIRFKLVKLFFSGTIWSTRLDLKLQMHLRPHPH